MNDRLMRGLPWLAAGLFVAACGGSTPASTDHATERRSPTAVDARSDVARPASTVATTRPRIVFLGDSLTAGYGLEKNQAVPSLIQEHLATAGYPYEVVNAGVSGDTSAGGL